MADIRISAKCIKSFQDKNNNDCVLLQFEYGDNVALKTTYLTEVPSVGQSCMVKVKARVYNEVPYLSYDVCKAF